MNYDYPEASYDRRKEIIKEHEIYQKGFMYFLANDPQVPEDIQKRINQWGLAADEFLDNGHWPHQIYVREARRMVSDFVMTENHLRALKPTPESIGMGSYNMDSHNVQRYVDSEGRVRNEGDVQISPGGPYPISYRSIIPPEKSCENLLVPVCLSSSHIAYGSIRMEPVFMILGQSAATAAVQAIENNISVQQVDYEDLKTQLLEDKQVLELARTPRNTGVSLKSLKGIVLDDSSAKLKGTWIPSQSTSSFVGSSYRHDNNEASRVKSATYETSLKPGTYEVRVSYSANPNRASNVPVRVTSAKGTESFTINQKQKPAIDGLFHSLGKFQFDQTGKVTISNEKVNGHVIIDAVQWLPVK